MEQFEEAEARLMGRMKELAAVPKERQTEEVLKVVADAQEAEAVRIAAVSALDHRMWRREVDQAARNMIEETLVRVWNNPRADMSTDLVMSIDYLLRARTGGWEKSDPRRRVMLERVFAPFPQEPKARQSAVQERDRVVGFLRDYLAHRPEEAGSLLIENMNDQKWPAQFRWRLAGQLQHAYQEADAEWTEWAAALQASYPKLIEAADPWALRLLSGSIKSGAQETGKRRFIAGKEIREALVRAGEKVKAIAALPDGDPEAKTAVHDVERALRALDAAK